MRSAYQNRKNSNLHRTLSENFAHRRREQDAICDVVFFVCVILLCVYICFILYITLFFVKNKFCKGLSQNLETNNTFSQNNYNYCWEREAWERVPPFEISTLLCGSSNTNSTDSWIDRCNAKYVLITIMVLS